VGGGKAGVNTVRDTGLPKKANPRANCGTDTDRVGTLIPGGESSRVITDKLKNGEGGGGLVGKKRKKRDKTGF